MVSLRWELAQKLLETPNGPKSPQSRIFPENQEFDRNSSGIPRPPFTPSPLAASFRLLFVLWVVFPPLMLGFVGNVCSPPIHVPVGCHNVACFVCNCPRNRQDVLDCSPHDIPLSLDSPWRMNMPGIRDPENSAGWFSCVPSRVAKTCAVLPVFARGAGGSSAKTLLEGAMKQLRVQGDSLRLLAEARSQGTSSTS